MNKLFRITFPDTTHFQLKFSIHVKSFIIQINHVISVFQLGSHHEPCLFLKYQCLKYFFWSIDFVYWVIDLLKCIFFSSHYFHPIRGINFFFENFQLPPSADNLRMYRVRVLPPQYRIVISIKSLDYVYLARII